MANNRITSRKHPVVQRLRKLAARRRDDPGLLLDGEHLLFEALAAGVAIDLVLTDGRTPDLAQRARAGGAAVYLATPSVLEAASPVRSPTGTVAIARWEPAALRDLFTSGTPQATSPTPQHSPALVIGLVDVQDPGNTGSVIRGADALGATGVAILDRGADPAGWRALRGAMGSTFRLPIARGSTAQALQEARSGSVAVAATVAADGIPVETADLRRPMLVLLGNEGAGLAEDVIAQADVRLMIPMRPGLDSLNVAVSAALILYEARRQRRAEASTR
jgi:TrmH family RNA methyltransferase